MNFIGISYGHNATVCLLESGKITFCQSEERFNRIKNSTGFPKTTLNHVYEKLVPPKMIDAAILFGESIFGYLFLKSINFKSIPYPASQCFTPEHLKKKTWKEKLFGMNLGYQLMDYRGKHLEKDQRLQKEANDYFCGELRLPPEKVLYCNHHLAHAYSTLPNVKELGECLIFTLDAEGDGLCANVNHYKDGKMNVLEATDKRHSLGYYYSFTTGLLGMKPNEHEFKVMGMAPYARKKYYGGILEKLEENIQVDNDGKWISKPPPTNLLSTLDEIYRLQRFDNVCGAIQELTETLVTRWIRIWIEKTGCRDIAVSGGVFMNVKANQKILEMDCVDSMYVMPSAGDETCSVGCAVWGYDQAGDNHPLEPISHLYLGVDYGDAEIEKALAETKAAERYHISRPESINRTVGKLLSEDVIVARCSGPMEFGARALGNRSILANAGNFQNLRMINDAIKNRDFWMPFCPSILDTDMDRYVVNHQDIFAPYMCITFDSKPVARKDLIAAIHPRDFTMRPQCVTKDWNPDYYEIISEFKERTGVGGILNTSFNLHGQPNVCNPRDAIWTVDNSGLTHLALNGYLLEKKASSSAPAQS